MPSERSLGESKKNQTKLNEDNQRQFIKKGDLEEPARKDETEIKGQTEVLCECAIQIVMFHNHLLVFFCPYQFQKVYPKEDV